MARARNKARLNTPGSGGINQAPTVVMCWQLLEVIDRHLAELQRNAKDKANLGWQHKAQEGVGIIAELTAKLTGKSPESIIRKLYDVRNGRRVTVDSRFADCLLLALGTTLANEGIAELPANRTGARAMADAHYFAKGEPTPIKDTLPDTLFNFAKGFVYWEADILIEDEAEAA